MPPALALEHIECTFNSRDDSSDRYTAVRDTTLRVAEGEFVSVVGPTGCGKTTLLNVAAGLLQPSAGTVTVFGTRLAGINSRAGYMFQTEALMPWRNAIANVMAGLEFRGMTREEAFARGAEIRLVPRFIEIHAKIWRAMKEEVLKGYAQQQRQ